MSVPNGKIVGVSHSSSARGYPRTPPFHPSVSYPEYLFREIGVEENWAYELVRRFLRNLGLDGSRYGTPSWNPLSAFVKPGDRVVLKPNLVAHWNWGKADGLTDTDSLVTHGSVIRAVADYVYLAMRGEGEILVGDSPVQATDWTQVCKLTGLDAIEAFYGEKGLKLRSRDFRLVVAEMEDNGLIRSQQGQNSPADYVEVDLGRDSLLEPIIADSPRFAVSGYGRGRMVRAHGAEKNAYLFPRVALSSDCFINLPKLKFHQKAGMTCSLKNLVGINGHKDYLPHFRIGIDEYPPGLGTANRIYWGLQHLEWNEPILLFRKALRLAGRVVRAVIPRQVLALGQGSWYGNDTLWRTILDINRAFFYYDIDKGMLAPAPQRRYLSIIDGIIGGQGESPLAPSPRVTGCIIGGTNPVAADAVAASIMGLNVSSLRQLKSAFDPFRFPLVHFGLDEIEVMVNDRRLSFQKFIDNDIRVPFEPSAGWRGRVERKGFSE